MAYVAIALAGAVAAAPRGAAAQATSVIDVGLRRSNVYEPVASSLGGEVLAITAFGTAAPATWSLQHGVIELGSILGYRAVASGISDDGSVVVGTVYTTGDRRAGTWDSSGVFTDLGLFAGVQHTGDLISADGSTFAITAWPSSSPALGPGEAFAWSATGGLLSLGSTQGGRVSVTAMSRDGGVLAGLEFTGQTDEARLFRWTSSSGIQALGPASAYFYGGANPCMSADGSVIMGRFVGSLGLSLFRWTEVSGSAAGDFQEIGLPSNSGAYSLHLTPNGTTLVGGLFGDTQGWFRWTEMGGLEIHPGDTSLAVGGISADASLVALIDVDYTSSFLTSESYRWTEGEGLVPLIQLRAGENTQCDALGVSADGSIVYGTQRLGDHQRVLVWPTDGTIGLSECGPAVPNSTGVPASIEAFGSNAVALRSLRLQASGLPPSAPAYMLMARSIQPTFPVPNSQGRLCLEPPLGRFDGPGQIGEANAAGQFSLQVDPISLAGPAGPFIPLWGETWSFQAWYRDGNPGPTSNFTNATTIRFR